MTAMFTFGDSILDCGRYNEHGVTPAALLARNDDRLFPEFCGRDLATLVGERVGVVPRAVDGSTVVALPRQLDQGAIPAASMTLLTIGRNDLRLGLIEGSPRDLQEFEWAVRAAFGRLTHTQLFVGNVYDPTFGGDDRNFLQTDPVVARKAHARVNEILASEAARVGGHLVDLHAHLLTGVPSWFTQVIEPSLTGASEVRRAFLAAWESHGSPRPNGRRS